MSQKPVTGKKRYLLFILILYQLQTKKKDKKNIAPFKKIMSTEETSTVAVDPQHLKVKE